MVSTLAHAVVIFSKLLVSVMILLKFVHAEDTMVQSQEISVGQTLISANKTFELGFFQPVNSSKRYMGIWFKDIPETIAWVANRDNPLSASDNSAKLILGNDGNLRILDGNQQSVWSTNISVQLNNSFAVLSDKGDLIVKDNTSGWIAWESFAHPCDVFLMTMESVINTKTGENPLLSSWRSEVDPTIGSFTSGLLPQAPLQSFVWNGTSIYWRSGPWNGLRFVGLPDKDSSYLDGWSIRQNKEEGIIYFSVNQNEKNITRIMKLHPEGSLKIMNWVGKNWNVTWEAPQNPCDVYGMCGPFGVCNANNFPICACPTGFVPKSVDDWRKGNWTDGCVRRTELLCSKSGFSMLSNLKIPDRYQYLSSGEDIEGCREGCMSNCSCTAYAFVDGIGCLLWTGDLIDMQEFSFSGEDLHIRLDHSELAKSKKVIIIVSIVSALFVIILCLLITFAVYKFRSKQQTEHKGILRQFFLGDATDSSSDVQQEHKWKNILQDELPTFDFEDIVAATNGFSHSNKVGEGGFGAVYRGKLHDGQEIAVKRLSVRSGQGENEFLNEILLISKLQHRNLVKILGCSVKREEKLIVYEYLPNRSLDSFVFDSSKKNKLDWPTRFNIIQGIARGMSYLHRDSRLKVIHRDLKASNVLLDNDMNPKISDFGLARIFMATQELANTHRVAGTYGYMSPEYALRGIFSEKSDVFSFGVLLLEIISGKKISNFDSNEQQALGLLGYAWKLWNESKELDLIDESLLICDSDQVKRCVHIGLVCVQDRADDRPTMPTVILMLSSDILIPKPKQPLFVPESPSELDKTNPVNAFTESLFEGR